MKKFFTLIAAVAMAASMNAQTAKVFTANTFLQTSQANVQAGITEGWIAAGSGTTAANGKKGSIDPQTKEEKGEGAVKLDGIGLKKDNDAKAKAFKMTITGVDNIEVYGVTTSSGDSRYISVVATAADGTTVEKDEITAPGNTAVVKVQLDKSKSYTVGITGVNEDKSAGADVALHGIWFNVGVTNGISNISVDSAKAGKTYNLAGQQVSDSYKGLVIKNGKKYVK